jgi:post-segregation antitoxin (ccd killing protein)
VDTRASKQKELRVGRLDVVVPDDLEKQFRMEVLDRFGAEKGALSKAIAEAMKLWLKEEERVTRKK